jgi:hypothetical protein
MQTDFLKVTGTLPVTKPHNADRRNFGFQQFTRYQQPGIFTI